MLDHAIKWSCGVPRTSEEASEETRSSIQQRPTRSALVVTAGLREDVRLSPDTTNDRIPVDTPRQGILAAQTCPELFSQVATAPKGDVAHSAR